MYVKDLQINVVEAAERRVLEVFNKNKIVSVSFSGGKDSIVMCDLLVRTMQKYAIPFSRLVVLFFDEEAIYEDVEEITLEWRSKFLSLGAKFHWFCLPFKHFNCCNRLENDETFICWEPGKEHLWVRPMPKFAIRNHKLFRMGMTYQEFGKRILKSIPKVVGLRVAESIQRRQSIARMTKSTFYYPIYDWRDNDVWLYMKLYNVKFPITYIYLYKCNVSANKLRISQFFSIDTIKTLPKVLEFYPNLYERVVRREPNADLAMLYWETDMFRSSRQDNTFQEDKKKDYQKLFKQEMVKASKSTDLYPGYKDAKKLYSKMTGKESQRTYRRLYQLLIAGDPKKRTYRVVLSEIYKDKKGV